ncbi:MAG: AAA family ATPase [Betaproteobacteria bacterium]|nr:AAA family ATPase [Betaproteobacteria bacterium]
MGNLPKEAERGAAFLDEFIARKTQGRVNGGASLEEMAEKLRVSVGTSAPATRTEHRCTEVVLQCADAIPLEPIRWFWPNWLAAGKVHILAGAPGTGKTTIALALAATITTGGRWPDGTHATPGRVVIWSGEDDPRDTLKPRLLAAGANIKMVRFVSGAIEGEEHRAFDPAKDTTSLCDAIVKAGGVQLLIVDPIVSAVMGDSHKSAEVRRGLQPLSDLAAATGCALLGISHFSKGSAGREPTERVTGSLAFGAVARVVLVTARRKEEEANAGGDRVLCRSKSNIGTDHGGVAYSLRQTELEGHPGIFASYVVWGNTIEGTAREILAEAEAQPKDESDGRKLGKAQQFLSELLAQGALPSETIKAESRDAGFSWATIRRAKKKLKIRSNKMTYESDWLWSLPDEETSKMLKKHEDAHQKSVSILAKFEHLGEEGDEKKSDAEPRDDDFIEVEI